jgi:hypothetical protein
MVHIQTLDHGAKGAKNSFTSGSSMNLIAFESASTISSAIGIGAGPTPRA